MFNWTYTKVNINYQPPTLKLDSIIKKYKAQRQHQETQKRTLFVSQGVTKLRNHHCSPRSNVDYNSCSFFCHYQQPESADIDLIWTKMNQNEYKHFDGFITGGNENDSIGEENMFYRGRRGGNYNKGIKVMTAGSYKRRDCKKTYNCRRFQRN